MKSYNSDRAGNLICHIVVETPVKLNAEQKDLLKKLEISLNGGDISKSDDVGQSSSSGAHSPQSAGFMKRMKKFFDDLKN